ncbi:MAG TPA: glycosyltransferase family A protein [Thermomicrobiales bacterium]
MVALTIGMATYNDFDGVYFTIQALRLYQDLDDTELLVVDNYGCEATKGFVEGWARGRYVLATDVVGTSASRDLLFRIGEGEAVLCCDSHVLFAPGVIARLKAYYRDHPDCADLLQGPLVYDDLKSISTHFDPVWRAQMWGTWGTDPRGLDPEGEPFDIPMQGLGAFSCRKSAWQGFNPLFRGFGGEEGYIHEKFRQAGARALCLPWLRWTHRFGRPGGVPYPLTIEAKLRNYVIGHSELGLPLAPILAHFAEHLPQERVVAVATEALRELSGNSLAATPIAAAPRRRGYSPLVSCICMTYNRPPDKQELVEEAIESFLRQTYANKELIVLNDCPGQELVCDAPGVRVVNVPARYPTLGAKQNAAIRFSQGELIALWDDDDISLPWRLSLSVERLGDADYFNPRAYWFLDGNGLHSDHAVGYAHNAGLFTRAAFEAIGGYPSISVGYDASMDSLLPAWTANVVDPLNGAAALTKDEWFYVYRWGVSGAHISGRGEGEAFYQELGTRPVQPGSYRLNPHWRRDYVAETRALVTA